MDYDGVGSCDVTPAAQDPTYQLRPSLVPISYCTPAGNWSLEGSSHSHTPQFRVFIPYLPLRKYLASETQRH